MPKSKVGIYYDLPPGGANRLMEGIVTSIANDFELVRLPVLSVSPNRLARDRQNFVDSYIFAKQLSSQIKKSGIQALLVSHDSFFACPTILSLSPVPTVLYCHEPTRALFEPELGVDPSLPLPNYIYESLYRKVKKVLEKYNARHAAKVLCNSCYSQQSIKHAYGLLADVVYPGIDTGLFKPAPPSPQGQTLRGKSILVIGNDEPQKRLSLAITAIGLLPKNIRPQLNIICPRTLPSKKLQDLAHRHGVKLSVKVGVSDQELIYAYQTALVTLVTALREPFGLSAAESQACGTPVVATNEGGVREIVQDGISGYLTEDSPKTIAHALSAIITHHGKTHAMGLAGCSYVLSQFAWANCTKGITTALNKVISSQ
ncbi:MAG: glycosyltransferase family 4 protein [bacterium]